MGIPDKKSIKRTQTISCQGVDVTKMNVFFTDMFWDNYGLRMGLQEDVKMSDLLFFMKCFSESWDCYLLSRRCQVTIFNFYFGVWRKAGLMWLDGWAIQSSHSSLCFPFILFWLFQGFCKCWTIVIRFHKDFKMHLAWRRGPGMPVAVHILTSKTSSPLEWAAGNVLLLGWLVDVDAGGERRILGREGGVVTVGVRTGGCKRCKSHGWDNSVWR